MPALMNILKNKLVWSAVIAAVVVVVFLMSGKKPLVVKAFEMKPGELRVIVNATTTSTI